MNDDLRIRSGVDRKVHGGLARRLLSLDHGTAVSIDAHQVLGREKSEGGVLASDQKLVFAEPATQVAAPTTDQPPFEEQFAPADHLGFEFRHRLAPEQRPGNYFRFDRSDCDARGTDVVPQECRDIPIAGLIFRVSAVEELDLDSMQSRQPNRQ